MGNLYKQMFFVGLIVIFIIVSLIVWITFSILNVDVKIPLKSSDTSVTVNIGVDNNPKKLKPDTVFINKKDTVRIYVEPKPVQTIPEPPMIQKPIILDSSNSN